MLLTTNLPQETIQKPYLVTTKFTMTIGSPSHSFFHFLYFRLTVRKPLEQCESVITNFLVSTKEFFFTIELV